MEEISSSSSSSSTPTNTNQTKMSRTSSFSSSLSSPSSSFKITPPLTPPSSSSSSSIPFSWEKQPGVPKAKPTQPISPNTSLPLPPPPKSTTPTKNRRSNSFGGDPFTMALMECSKEQVKEEDKVARKSGNNGSGSSSISTTLRDWFGFRFGLVTSFDIYASCKTTSSIAESNVYVPKSSRATLSIDGEGSS